MSIGDALFSSTRLGVCSSARDDWRTPPEVLEVVRAVAPIWLDPCHGAGSIVDARVRYGLGEDGLRCPWSPDHTDRAYEPHLVYCNPPYGDIRRWAVKIEVEARRGVEIVALVPARTDTRWMRPLLAHAVVAFWHGRLRFLDAPASAPFPSALLYLGPRWERFLNVVRASGKATPLMAIP